MRILPQMAQMKAMKKAMKAMKAMKASKAPRRKAPMKAMRAVKSMKTEEREVVAVPLGAATQLWLRVGKQNLKGDKVPLAPGVELVRQSGARFEALEMTDGWLSWGELSA